MASALALVRPLHLWVPPCPSEDRTDEHDRPLAPQQCQTSASYAVQPRFCCQTQRRVGHVKANPARQLPSKLRNTYDKNAQKQISDHVTRQIAGRKKTRCQYMEGVSDNVPEQKACTQSPVQGRARACQHKKNQRLCVNVNHPRPKPGRSEEHTSELQS